MGQAAPNSQFNLSLFEYGNLKKSDILLIFPGPLRTLGKYLTGKLSVVFEPNYVIVIKPKWDKVMQFNEPIKWLRVAPEGLDLPHRFVVLSHPLPPENH